MAGTPQFKLIEGFYDPTQCTQLLQWLISNVAWKQETVAMFGREVRVPRLTAWYGDEDTSYRYSGVEHLAPGWLEPLNLIRQRVETAADSSFNSVLLNRYRDGNDSVAWHADDEPELGANPVIASLSLGATRRFQFRRKPNKASFSSRPSPPITLDLHAGTLLIMMGATQSEWLHRIPKTRRQVAERINLTFRHVQHD